MLFILLGVVLAVTGGTCETVLEVMAQEGSQAVLPCLVSDSQSTHYAAFQWVKKGKRGESTVCRREKSGLVYRGSVLGHRSHCLGSQFGDYSLYIDAVREEDAGQHVCSVQGHGLGRGTTTWKVMLRVMKVSFSLPEAIEGDKLQVKCIVTPKPDMLYSTEQYRWKLNGVDYKGNGYRRSSIPIPSVSQSDRGNWTCCVDYRGKATEATQFLRVKGIEHPSNNNALVYAAIGSNTILPCVFTQGLTSNATWSRLSKGSSSSSSFYRLGSNSRRHPPPSLPLSFIRPPLSPTSLWDQSARLERVELGDEGSYVCSGTVESRMVKRELELVTARVLSSPSTKRTPLTLTCQLSNDKEVTKYEWVRVTYDNSSVATVTPVGKNKTLKLTEDDMGEWVCRYYGERGLLGNVTYHLHLMGGLESGRPEEQSYNRGALVIGFGILILLVLLIALQIYRNHQRRKMILPYPALENIVHSLANERERRERRGINVRKNSEPMEEQA
ncbi:hypothetical protein AALO_G00178960 [Alosa alosa]|uniref:Ig-like domain-containing protein n=1 Tax=Alosa alosa TaxID=278164 RepID=A0AAV6GDE0_9TELE|nr:CD4-1 molecule [Alosa alosa]KAG5271372.1 hypothetical protein AALO_G00178960 [Alosa alosa]